MYSTDTCFCAVADSLLPGRQNTTIGVCSLAQVVDNPADADFVLAHGTEAIGQPHGAEPQDATMQHINALLQSCAKQQVPPPMVVANPDIVTVSGSDLIPMPGTLAEYYAGLGGKVCHFRAKWCSRHALLGASHMLSPTLL